VDSVPPVLPFLVLAGCLAVVIVTVFVKGEK
jgi:hypothetical protein